MSRPQQLFYTTPAHAPTVGEDLQHVSHKQPLVSMVTPVYNGEKYLAECIDSVLAQTYENWEYVIVDNCSTDRSLEIAQNYAKKDSRIRASDSDKFPPLMPNWNRALRQISHDSKYCKVVHADDLLFPDCVARMVAVADAYPSVGVVAAYRLVENSISLDGFPSDRTVVSGREICRSSLLGGPYIFGSPTSLLIVSDLIRSRETFYNEVNLHADVEACYDVLQNFDFGFVHQILTYTRRHDESVTHAHQRLGTVLMRKFSDLRKYGPVYLGEEEYRDRLKLVTRRYFRFLFRSVLLGRLDVWKYHKHALEQVGDSLRARDLAIEFVTLLTDRLRHSGTTIKRTIKEAAANKK